jgi:hypothetical protein
MPVNAPPYLGSSTTRIGDFVQYGPKFGFFPRNPSFYLAKRRGEFLVSLKPTHAMTPTVRLLGVSLAALAIASNPAQAQTAAQAKAEKPVFEEIQSPQIPTQSREKRFTPRDWLEMEAAITIDARPVPPSGMLDRLVVKWYVAIKNPDKAGEFFKLTREVTHVNVPIGEPIYSSVYLSPSSIRRITGNYRNAKGSVEFVGVEVIFNGEPIAHATNKGPDQWWTKASDKISESDSVPLMTKPETPFAALWWDRYAEVAIER